MPAASQAPSVPECFGREATIVGTQEGDDIHGTEGRDVIVTLAGDDRVDGEPEESAHVPGQSEDLICLGPGDDYACGGGFPGRVYSCEYGDVEDRLLGGPGQDRLLARRSWGGAGDDVVSFSTFGGGPEHRLFGGPGADLVEGTYNCFFDPPCSAGKYVLRGGSGPDALFGHEGNDLLAGGRSDDETRRGRPRPAAGGPAE